VENVSISFATSAKRVDVRKLKTALWREIEEGTRANSESVLGFSGLVRGVASKNQQTDVTMPFYFICLLHLCNEKNLALLKNDSGIIDDFDLKKNVVV
jgi:condensin complex subunit 2